MSLVEMINAMSSVLPLQTAALRCDNLSHTMPYIGSSVECRDSRFGSCTVRYEKQGKESQGFHCVHRKDDRYKCCLCDTAWNFSERGLALQMFAHLLFCKLIDDELGI